MRNLDGHPLRVVAADPAEDGGVRIARYPTSCGRPVKVDHVPTRIEWQGRQAVPDVDQPFGILSVPERFKEIVEQLEPGVHQFLPVAFVDIGGKHPADRWFFIVCNRIDSVDRRNTTLVLADGRVWMPEQNLPEDKRSSTYDPGRELRLVFDSNASRGIQAWCDKYLMNSRLISDELADRLGQQHSSGIFLSEAESV